MFWNSLTKRFFAFDFFYNQYLYHERWFTASEFYWKRSMNLLNNKSFSKLKLNCLKLITGLIIKIFSKESFIKDSSSYSLCNGGLCSKNIFCHYFIVINATFINNKCVLMRLKYTTYLVYMKNKRELVDLRYWNHSI